MKPLRLVALVALLGLAPPAASSAAPVPAARDTAKERLEGLKKRLPALVASWEKKHWGEPGKVEVRLVRMVGPGEAKATFYYHARGSLTPHYIFSVWLTYHDGRWTTRRSVVSWPSSKESHTAAVHLLMLAIDESE